MCWNGLSHHHADKARKFGREPDLIMSGMLSNQFIEQALTSRRSGNVTRAHSMWKVRVCVCVRACVCVCVCVCVGSALLLACVGCGNA